MNKRILTSAVALASFSALTIPTVASADYTYRVPIYQTDIDRNYDSDTDPGPGPGPGDPGPSDPTEPNYCDLDQNLVDQWSSADITSSTATDSGLFKNSKLYFTSSTNGLSGSQLPQFPSKCFETITLYNSGIKALDFLNNVTKGETITINATWGITDFSGVKNVIELDNFYLDPNYSEYDIQLIEQKIPSDAWLCQPEQELVFTGLSQDKLCDTPEMTPWEQYSYDLSQVYTSEDYSYGDWNSIIWSVGSSSNPLKNALPSEPYPVSNPNTVDLSGFDFENIGGLAYIQSIASLYLGELNNNLVDLSNFNFEVSNTIHLPSGIQERSGFQPIPSNAFLCQPENSSVYEVVGAQQDDVCQKSITFDYNWDNYLNVFRGTQDPNYQNLVLDFTTYNVDRVADLYYDNNSNEYTFSSQCWGTLSNCDLIIADLSFDSQFPTMAQDPYPVSTDVYFNLSNSSHIDNIDSLRSISSGSLSISGNSGLTMIDLSENSSAQHTGLVSAGVIEIVDNQNLKTIKLNSLVDLQRLYIEDNPKLETVEIKNLSSIGPRSSSVEFKIRNNPMLSNIDIGFGVSTIQYGQILSQPLEIDLSGNPALSDVKFLQRIDYSNDTGLNTTVKMDTDIDSKSGFIKLDGSVCNVRRILDQDSNSEAIENGRYKGRFTNSNNTGNSVAVCNSVNFIN